MEKHIPIIRTKLLAPKFKEESIRRAKLTRKMKAIPNYPLTLVHSSAGYGKSTALALYVNDEKIPCCWYSITSSDDDILPFLTYIVSAIQTISPSFAKELLLFMKELDPYIREEELNILCSLFINEIILVDAEITLILDDYHQIEHSYNVNRWMEILLEHIPSNLHLIVSSRSRPQWKPLTKMKVSNRLLEITKDDLVLTKDEVELLLSDYYEIDIKEEQLEEIFNLTEGWVIALCLIAQQIPENVDFTSYLHKPLKTLQDLFHYLALEVFEKQSPMIQQFLEQTSVFDEIDEDICQSVLGISGASLIFQQIIEKNLFIQKIGDKQYRYHALFKEFLEEQLRKNQPRSFMQLHEGCARYYERNKQIEMALTHYQKINHSQAVAALLSDFGGSMLENGKLENLHDRLQKIPESLMDQFYTLWFLKGEVERYRSQYSEAELSYERAIVEAEKRGNQLEKSKAIEGKVKIYLDTIQPTNAERLLSQAIEIREQNELSSEEEIGKLYRLLAENLINSGQALKAEKWIKRAQAFKADIVDGNLEARLYLRTGRLERAKKTLLLTRKKHVEQKKHLPQSHRETDLLLALIEAFTGNGLEAKALAQEGIQHGIESGSPFVEACGWMRMGHAVQLLEKYEPALARECYDTALEMMDRIHVERGKAEPLMGLCILYGNRGEYERALEAGYAALQETEKVNDVWLSAYIMVSMGIASIHQQQFVQAATYLEQAEKMFTSCHDEFGKMLAYFWQATASYIQKNDDLFERNIALFLRQIQQGEYEFFFQKRTVFGPRDLQLFAPLLIEAGKKGIASHYVVKLLKEMELTELTSHPGYTLRIETLGQFKVWIGERQVEEKDWQRGKAKELLQLFSTRLYHLFPKEEIFQKLWPGLDEKSAARDFKVALNALNNALEPNRKARISPFFILREGTSYGFNAHAGIELDTVVFEEWISVGLEEKKREKAIHCLLKGLALYKGDFLPERRYEDWCLNEKERLQVLYLRSAEKLAQLYVRIEDYEQAIYWCERILEKEPTWEEAYRLLMFCYYRKNNRPFALKWYQKCCEILEDELGVSPLEPTRHMYEMIIEAKTNIESI